MKTFQNFRRRFGDMCVMAVPALLLFLTLVSCDEHEPIDLNIHPGHILTANGNVVSSDTYFELGMNNAAGVIFTEQQDDGSYLAVMLKELPAEMFCDSTDMVNGTSCDLTAFDGFTNTIEMRNSYDQKSGHGSPLAEAVYSSHTFGQSDYIPSVAEMMLLYAQRSAVNAVLLTLDNQQPGSADLLALDGANGECWYWTSTEVKEDQYHKAWLFTMNAGTYQDTPKRLSYHARPIVRYYPFKSNS